jgi:hypothetical protein
MGGCARDKKRATPYAKHDPPANSLSLNDSYTTSGTVSTVGFVVGGVAAVGTVALWLFWPKSSHESTAGAWVAPYLDPAGRGMGMKGRF